jgi:hypothetical protein
MRPPGLTCDELDAIVYASASTYGGRSVPDRIGMAVSPKHFLLEEPTNEL